MEQARLADTRVRHGGDDLPMAGTGLLGRVLECLNLSLAADKLCQSRAAAR